MGEPIPLSAHPGDAPELPGDNPRLARLDTLSTKVTASRPQSSLLLIVRPIPRPTTPLPRLRGPGCGNDPDFGLRHARQPSGGARRFPGQARASRSLPSAGSHAPPVPAPAAAVPAPVPVPEERRRSISRRSARRIPRTRVRRRTCRAWAWPWTSDQPLALSGRPQSEDDVGCSLGSRHSSNFSSSCSHSLQRHRRPSRPPRLRRESHTRGQAGDSGSKPPPRPWARRAFVPADRRGRRTLRQRSPGQAFRAPEEPPKAEPTAKAKDSDRGNAGNGQRRTRRQLPPAKKPSRPRTSRRGLESPSRHPTDRSRSNPTSRAPCNGRSAAGGTSLLNNREPLRLWEPPPRSRSAAGRSTSGRRMGCSRSLKLKSRKRSRFDDRGRNAALRSSA